MGEDYWLAGSLNIGLSWEDGEVKGKPRGKVKKKVGLSGCILNLLHRYVKVRILFSKLGILGGISRLGGLEGGRDVMGKNGKMVNGHRKRDGKGQKQVVHLLGIGELL